MLNAGMYYIIWSDAKPLSIELQTTYSKMQTEVGLLGYKLEVLA